MSTVYALELENKKFYIGATSKIDELKKGFSKFQITSQWVKIHKPLKLLEEYSADDITKSSLVKYYMIMHGIENVRGGGYNSLTLKASMIQNIQKLLDNVTVEMSIDEMNNIWESKKINRRFSSLPNSTERNSSIYDRNSLQDMRRVRVPGIPDQRNGIYEPGEGSRILNNERIVNPKIQYQKDVENLNHEMELQERLLNDMIIPGMEQLRLRVQRNETNLIEEDQKEDFKNTVSDSSTFKMKIKCPNCRQKYTITDKTIKIKGIEEVCCVCMENNCEILCTECATVKICLECAKHL